MLDRIVFVVGYGRSGSTLLDMMLGGHPDIFGAGEILTICRHVWPNNEYCSCHQRVRSCSLWSGAIAEWQQSGVNIAAHHSLQRRIEPILSLRRAFAGNDLRTYCEQTLALYQIVARRTGRRVILDSSKSPGRAMALLSSGIDVRLIHLVRDPRAVAHSMSKPMSINTEAGVQKKLRAHPIARTAFRWNFVNAGAERAMLRIPEEHGLRLRYEDMIADPAGALRRVGAVVGADLAPLGDAIVEGGMITAYHQVAGSRIRMTGAMRLNPDMGWVNRMSDVAQSRVSRICHGRMRRYGYKSSVSSGSV